MKCTCAGRKIHSGLSFLDNHSQKKKKSLPSEPDRKLLGFANPHWPTQMLASYTVTAAVKGNLTSDDK